MIKGRERSKCDCILLIFCEIVNYVTKCSVFVLYEIKMENKKTFFFVKIGIFCRDLGKKNTFWHWKCGRNSPKNRVIESQWRAQGVHVNLPPVNPPPSESPPHPMFLNSL